MLAWSYWRTEFDDWDASQAVPFTAEIVSARYVSAVRKLGDPIASNVTNDMKIDMATGNIEKTVNVIQNVLNEYEVDHLPAGAKGGALSGTAHPAAALSPFLPLTDRLPAATA
eukprot:2559918-Prymnesium_polylepis.1